MYGNGYGYGIGVDDTELIGTASGTGGYGVAMPPTADITGVFNDTEPAIFSAKHILLGVLSLAVVVNVGFGLFIYSKKSKPSQPNKHTTLNPMVRNGTIWTDCNAGEL